MALTKLIRRVVFRMCLAGSLLTFAAGVGFTQTVSFSPATNFAVGNSPVSVAVGDFNGDGKKDLAVANENTNNVSILLGTGTGSFAAATNFSVGTRPRSVAVGDFNGDGKQDLAVANEGTNNVSILLGTGTGSFATATSFAAGSAPHSVAVGDFNGDGKQDLVVANYFSNTVSILLGTGTRSFGTATNFAVGTNPNSVAVGDFNGDGKQDLAVENKGSNNVSILLGTGTGSFGVATNYAVGSLPVLVVVGDFNGDGKQDLAVPNEDSINSNNVSILLGTGTGSFGAGTNFPTGGIEPRSVAVGDFNGDGIQDLAMPNENSANLSILLGTGTGTFGVATNFAVGTTECQGVNCNGPFSVAVGDFNGDGKPDLAVANDDSNDVWVLLNSTSFNVIPTLSINDVSVTEGNSGTTNAVFTVTLSAVSSQSVTVHFATADNTATAGSDYVATSGTLTFNPGDTTKTGVF